MYRRPKFLETLLAIRRDMAREADYDLDLLAEMARTGKGPETAYSKRVVDEYPPNRALLRTRSKKQG